MRKTSAATYNETEAPILSPVSVPATTSELHSVLKKYWGYEAFRPLQGRVVQSLLNGHDVAVVMPTGGGKSLCYQLPAVVLGRTALVVSPLIALMQDQAAQLEQMGIPAAALNSSQPWPEQQEILRRAVKGEYRLLYTSPERLLRDDFIDFLQHVPLAFFAIDEAHCISEWGHEFRPEYRQLSRLRDLFPDLPVAAFTASATQQVRHDMLRALKLHEPHRYIASFHRPNLNYYVKACDSKTQPQLLLRAMEAYEGSTVIVYSPTVARVGETVEFLRQAGIAALPYHGKMENAGRSENQERWMNDEVRVLVGTIAFGLGINKPSVRAVIHLSLPKSVEQYYQEAGRAGRDGEPADCILLWQKKDAGLIAYFNNQIAGAVEKERAWASYHTIRNFAENAVCRHRQICLHFGETPKWAACGACDVCVAEPEWMREPERRVRATASATVEPGLFAHLKEWRRLLAKEMGVPAYRILSDASLRDLCHKRPSDEAGLLDVFGIGEKKAEALGEEILEALEQYTQ